MDKEKTISDLEVGDTALFVPILWRDAEPFIVHIHKVGKKWLRVSKWSEHDANSHFSFRIDRHTGLMETPSTGRASGKLWVDEAAYLAEQEFNRLKDNIIQQLKELPFSQKNIQTLNVITRTMADNTATAHDCQRKKT